MIPAVSSSLPRGPPWAPSRQHNNMFFCVYNIIYYNYTIYTIISTQYIQYTQYTITIQSTQYTQI